MTTLGQPACVRRRPGFSGAIGAISAPVAGATAGRGVPYRGINNEAPVALGAKAKFSAPIPRHLESGVHANRRLAPRQTFEDGEHYHN
jgi:hypothetical protein